MEVEAKDISIPQSLFWCAIVFAAIASIVQGEGNGTVLLSLDKMTLEARFSPRKMVRSARDGGGFGCKSM